MHNVLPVPRIFTVVYPVDQNYLEKHYVNTHLLKYCIWVGKKGQPEADVDLLKYK